MNYNPAYLLDMENYTDIDGDADHIVFYNVTLTENNIYGLPSKPEMLPSYYMLAFYGDEIYIAFDEDEDICKTFDVTKLTVKEQ